MSVMPARFLLLLILLFSLVKYSNAQVRRKGVTPVQKGNRPGNSIKKADFTIDQFRGKWQEYERINRDSNFTVPFTDSIQLIFGDSSKVQTRTSVSSSVSMNGDAEIDDDNNLSVAADEYTVKSCAKNEMTLDDNEKYLHRLRRVEMFWYESLGKLSVKQDEYSNSIKVPVSSVMGKWSVYRRQAKPGAVTNDMRLIKYLNILTKTSDSTATGDVTFYQGQSAQQLPCTVSVSDGSIKIVAGENSWNYLIKQADATNFIFGNEGILYFSKSE